MRVQQLTSRGRPCSSILLENSFFYCSGEQVLQTCENISLVRIPPPPQKAAVMACSGAALASSMCNNDDIWKMIVESLLTLILFIDEGEFELGFRFLFIVCTALQNMNMCTEGHENSAEINVAIWEKYSRAVFSRLLTIHISIVCLAAVKCTNMFIISFLPSFIWVEGFISISHAFREVFIWRDERLQSNGPGSQWNYLMSGVAVIELAVGRFGT